MNKFDYVREAIAAAPAGDAGDGRHTCHWPGCTKRVPPAAWGCKAHWYRLPFALRRKIWAAFRPGQEVTKTPARSYVDVAREVQEWIRANT